MTEYKEKDIELLTSYWQPEVGGAKNTHNYLLKFLVCEYSSDVKLLLQLEYEKNETLFYLRFELEKGEHKKKFKLPPGILTRRWKVRLYNLDEKTIDTQIQYLGVLGIAIPIGDRER